MKKKRLDQYKEEMKQYANADGSYTIYQNPAIDHLIILTLGSPVPTKQDKFKPLKAFVQNEDGTEAPVANLYKKLEDTDMIKQFNEHVRKAAFEVFTVENRVKRPEQVEVIIHVSTLKRRYNEVDVDNLAKCVLDALNGIAFDDDSQVATLICQKHVHAMEVDGLLIAITKITPTRRGILGDPAIYSFNPWKT
ncbi:RusA family crossover junction endodeoxyribonuclease [Pedobacter faecalis]|uniref:RusA family crossover junction endodeoxyribonuclease n=1 Tax=Pedobacter faecalis TaxID=3041495 RepID=UPI00254A5893|nr:RusA family crossover junction endodeoxyribonuclease [Pedobacter sp. ELA7]